MSSTWLPEVRAAMNAVLGDILGKTPDRPFTSKDLTY